MPTAITSSPTEAVTTPLVFGTQLQTVDADDTAAHVSPSRYPVSSHQPPDWYGVSIQHWIQDELFL